MGLFDFLKGKKAAPEKPVSKETPVQEKPAAPATPLAPVSEKPAAPAAEPESASTPELPVSLEGTPEKFRPMAEELLPPLLELLRSLCALEAEIFARSQQLEADKLKAGIPRSQEAPGWRELMEEYKERYGGLVQDRCTEELLARGYARSCGKPAGYDYLNTGCRLAFTMKSAKRAVLEATYPHGVDMLNQFVLRNTDEGWRIAEVHYGFASEPGKWHKHHI